MRVWESELEKPKVQMVCLISFHGIFSFQDADSDHIDEVDEVYTCHWHRCSDFSSDHDRESSYEKCEDDRPRITHNPSTTDITSCHEKCHRYEDSEDHEDELAIFLRCLGRIGEVELQCESSKDHKCDKRISSGESGDTIRKIDTIKYEYIPDYSQDQRDDVDEIELSEYFDGKKVLTQVDNPSEKPRNIADFYTRESDNHPDPYLHDESEDRWYSQATFADRIEIIDEAHDSDDAREDDDDVELVLEGWTDREEKGKCWSEDKQCGDDSYTDPIRYRITSPLCMIEVRSIEERNLSPEHISEHEYAISESKWESDEDEKCKKKCHRSR